MKQRQNTYSTYNCTDPLPKTIPDRGVEQEVN